MSRTILRDQDGLLREDKTGKPDFTYVGELYPEFARIMLRFQEGEVKYERLNFTSGTNPLTYKQSAARHFNQWIAGQDDEDHASATIVNILMAETIARLNS